MRGIALAFALLGSVAANAAAEKEWTMLVFLNGHNNLDRYGYEDINEMEVVGSTDQINVVVQWASSSQQNTKRLLVQKDNDKSIINSPTVQTLPRVDMGDHREFVNFVKWGIQNYPAKKYFVTIWNHGSGWHVNRLANAFSLNNSVEPDFQITDISNDDYTGNKITTEQLGASMAEISAYLGRKVDVYGSDACLMAMVEVSDLMADTVTAFVGSQELEPGDGWPYDDFLAAWTKNPTAEPAQVGQMLNQAYLTSYSGGSQGNSAVTLSTLNLGYTGEIRQAIAQLANELKQFPIDQKAKITSSASTSQYFYYRDYVDLISFVEQLEKNGVLGTKSVAATAVRAAVAKYVSSNSVSQRYTKARGISLWFPSSVNNFNVYNTRYQALSFARESTWGALLDHLF